MPESPLTPVELLVLSGLEDRARYGYELVERIQELSRGRIEVRPGNLYRVLNRLAERGLVKEVPAEEVAVEAGDPRRQYFGLTPGGRRTLVAELSMYADVLGGLKGPRLSPGEAGGS